MTFDSKWDGNTYIDLWRPKSNDNCWCFRYIAVQLLFDWVVSSKIRRRCLLRRNAKRSQIYNGKHTLCFATAVKKYLTYSVIIISDLRAQC